MFLWGTLYQIPSSPPAPTSRLRLSFVATEWARTNKAHRRSERRAAACIILPILVNSRSFPHSFVSWRPQIDTAAAAARRPTNDQQRQRASERLSGRRRARAESWAVWSAAVAVGRIGSPPLSLLASPLILARSLIHMSNITHATAAAAAAEEETVIMGDYSAAAAAAGPSLFACSC